MQSAYSHVRLRHPGRIGLGYVRLPIVNSPSQIAQTSASNRTVTCKDIPLSVLVPGHYWNKLYRVALG
jgi:hypothetical protein